MLPASLRSRLKLPLIAAPMFLVSGPALVKAACRAGVIGSFPTANCRTIEELDAWLSDIGGALGRAAGPVLPEPDRASFQSAPRGRPCCGVAARGGDGDHLGRLTRAGHEAAKGR